MDGRESWLDGRDSSPAAGGEAGKRSNLSHLRHGKQKEAAGKLSDMALWRIYMGVVIIYRREELPSQDWGWIG